MTTDDELRRMMQDAVGEIAPSPDLSDRVVARSRIARRPWWKSSGWQVTGAIVATALFVGVVATVQSPRAARPVPSETPATDVSPSPSPDRGDDDLTRREWEARGKAQIRWAMDLPLGNPPKAVWIYRDRLHAGDLVVPTPATVRRDGYTFWPHLSWTIDDGWIMSVPLSSGWENVSGVLTPTGEFQPFADEWKGNSSTYGCGLSPDRTRLSVGEIVVELPEGNQVGEGPPDLRSCNAWTDQGMVYQARGDGRNDYWLWDGSERTPLPESAGSLRSDGFGLNHRSRGTCDEVVRLTQAGEVVVVREFCEHDLGYLSPDARSVLTHADEVLDVATGGLVGNIDRPPEFSDVYPEDVLWEDETTVLLLLSHEFRAGGEWRRQAVFVRCDVSGERCERASGLMRPVSYGEPTLRSIDPGDPVKPNI